MLSSPSSVPMVMGNARRLQGHLPHLSRSRRSSPDADPGQAVSSRAYSLLPKVHDRDAVCENECHCPSERSGGGLGLPIALARVTWGGAYVD